MSVEVEVVKENQLAVIVKESGLEQTKANIILAKFQDYFALAASWEKRAKGIVVTKDNQKADMAMARVGRLELREKRIAIENTRKELKEQSLREGKAIDGVANVLKALIVPIEEYLEQQEKFVELQVAREAAARREEADKKAEEDRLAQEKAEAEERARIKADNERLTKENEAKEKALQKEREKAEKTKKKQEEELRAQQEEAARVQRQKDEEARKERERLQKAADAKLAKERAERERIEKELQAKKDEDNRIKAEAEAKAEAERRAGDKEKIMKLRADLLAFQIPDVKSAAAKQIVATVKEALEKLAGAIKVK